MPRYDERVASLDDVPGLSRGRMQTQNEMGGRYGDGGVATGDGTSGQWAYESDPGVGVSAGL